MFAIPPTADIADGRCHVCFVPKADILPVEPLPRGHACDSNNGPLTQYEMPFKLSMTTFQISIIAITPAMASHKARHPSCNFSVFMAKVRSNLVAAE
jgi:hypothetical protein